MRLESFTVVILPDETLLPLGAAVEKATGDRPHPSTLHRWRLRGVSGVKLPTVKVGGRRKTSIEAVRRFIEATTAAADGGSLPKPRTNRQREAAIAAAERELEAATN
ncbi:MAG: DUF1580 domain-containing protein [Lacipirellulaceae bacterium]